MSRLNHNFASLVGEVKPGQRPISQGRQSTTAVRYEFKSTIRQPIFYRNALGIVVHEPPAVALTAEEYFYITIEYEFDPGVKIDARELLNELALSESHVERKEIYQTLENLERLPHWQSQRRFHYTLGISRQRLEELGGVVYLNDVDLVVGFEQYAADALHPYSQPGVLAALSASLPSDAGTHIRYMLVDNSGVHGSLWINTGYEVFELRPVRNAQCSDGVYVSTRQHTGGRVETKHYSMEEALKTLGLYRTRNEAEVYGHPETRFKAELAARETELLVAKQELAARKQAFEKEQQELKERWAQFEQQQKLEEAERKRQQAIWEEQTKRRQEELEMIKRALDHEREMHANRQKYYYDDMARQRKDQTDNFKALVEIAKTMLSLVGVGLSIWALAAKRSEKK